MNYVCFENKGEVPINAFKLLGASTKRGSATKIGYFGTGLKYAIAVMLKQGIDFKVYSGTKEVKIGTRKTKFMTEDILVMTVNGEKTSITLDAGIDWKPWFAIREIYSNTIDEGGNMSLNTEVGPKAGHTRIFVDTEAEALKDVFQNWNNYFSMNRALVFRNATGTLLPKLPTRPEFTVFRRGIRVHESRKHSVFDYDLIDVEINESRVAVYSFRVHENSSEVLAASPLTSINEFLRLAKNGRRGEFIEWQDEFWDFTSSYSFSEDWLLALNDKRLVPANFAGHYDITETTQIVPDKLLDKLQKRFGEAINVAGDNRDKFTIVQIDKQPLAKMLEVYAIAGFDWKLDDIDIVRFNDKDLLGMAKDGRVLLSANLFTPAHRHEIAATLIEEITHAKTGLSDGTRGLQNFLFNTITNMAKELFEVKGEA
jgi:hypothetical protein